MEKVTVTSPVLLSSEAAPLTMRSADAPVAVTTASRTVLCRGRKRRRRRRGGGWRNGWGRGRSSERA